MSQPFYQPARQNFSSSQSMQQPQGGFGGFGGGQMPQQNWGGGQAFGGFGGGQGFNFGGGQAFGGFQQPQFNPFQGGFGGGFGSGFSPFQGGFGGFNPMFGGIGGLGFNPMMGQGFGMPMQGFNPYQQQMQLQQPQQNPFAAQDAELTSQMQSAPEYQAFENARKSWEGSEGYKSYQQKRQDLVRQMQESQRQQPMYGGIGGLGFNPMMGPQFGMPMQQFGRYGDQSRGASQQRSLTSGMTPQQIALFREQEKQNTLSKQAASGSPIQEFLLRKQSGGLPTGFLDDVDTKTFLGLKGDLTPEQQTQRDQLANTLISKFADAGQLSDYEKQQFSTQEGRYDWNYGRKPLGAPR